MLYIAFLARLAETQGQAGDSAGAARTIDDALRAASSIPPDKEHAERSHDFFALRQIAGAQMKLGDLEGAMKTAALVRFPKRKFSVLYRIAEMQVEMGDYEGGLKTATTAGDLDNILLDIGRAQVQAGDFSRALKSADSIQAYPHYKDWILDDLSVAQAKAGDWDSATAAFDRPRATGRRPMSDRRDGIIEMTEAKAAQGGAETAYQWAMDLELPEERAAALIGIARGMPNIE